MNLYAAVQDGAVLLDDYFEDRHEWTSRVDPNSLDITHPGKCILGQVFGGFVRGCDRLDIHMYDAFYYGMDTPDVGDDPDFDDAIAFMECEWRKILVEA